MLADEHPATSSLRPGVPGEPSAGLHRRSAEVVPIADAVLDLDLNPNRVDLLGVYGVAREVHAITGAPLAPAPWEDDAEATGEGSVSELASVRVEVPELCPRFTARAFTGVEIGPSPLWMKARLMAAGPAADLQRRRHHQLRDAADRAAASLLRPRQGPRRRGDRPHRDAMARR